MTNRVWRFSGQIKPTINRSVSSHDFSPIYWKHNLHKPYCYRVTKLFPSLISRIVRSINRLGLLDSSTVYLWWSYDSSVSRLGGGPILCSRSHGVDTRGLSYRLARRPALSLSSLSCPPVGQSDTVVWDERTYCRKYASVAIEYYNN